MLVLSRKPDNSIVIGSDIEVTVLSVTNQRVKLGIRAPGHVRIVRTELLPEQGGSPAPPVGDLLDEPCKQRLAASAAMLPR